MPRSFSLVDHRLAETDFFLKKLSTECDFFAARCYLSAFVASARAVTYALQAVMKPVPGFADWYGDRQLELKGSPTAQFFHRFRRVNHHIGENLLSRGSSGPDRIVQYWFAPTKDVPEVPKEDVVTACRLYMDALVRIVYQCYADFGTEINAHQHYTAEHFSSLGRSIEDAEEEVFGVRGWTKVPGYSDDFRWQAVRDSLIGCEIEDLFVEYLGYRTPRPARPE